MEREQRVDAREVVVHAGNMELGGSLGVPPGAMGLVLFAHGSSTGRFIPRNRRVARALWEVGLATLLFDLLSDEEEIEQAETGALRFDIPFLARRLEAAMDWTVRQLDLAHLRVGLFGASTGAAAALVVAALRPDSVHAVVCRSGRPDLAAPVLGHVRAPTLLMVGGQEPGLLELNEEALGQLRALKDIRIIPGATHRFDDTEALAQVSVYTADWFSRYLLTPRAEARP